MEVGKDDVEVEDSLEQLERQLLQNKDDELEHDVQLDDTKHEQNEWDILDDVE